MLELCDCGCACGLQWKMVGMLLCACKLVVLCCELLGLLSWVPGRPASERAVAKFIECLPCLPQTIHLRPTSCTKGYTPRYTPVYARVYPGQGNIYQTRCSLKACIGRPSTHVRLNGCLLQGDLMARRPPGDPPEDTRVYAWVYPQSGAGTARMGFRGGLHPSAQWQSS